MPTQFTSTAQSQGRRNLLICAIGSLVVWLAITAAVSYLTGRTFVGSFELSFALIGGAVFLLFIGTWLYGLSTRGPVVLDCGPHPHRRNFVAMAVISVVAALAGGPAATTSSSLLVAASPFFGICSAAFWLVIATGRLQVHENGLWIYWNLVQWRKIRSYLWAPDATLMYKARFRGAIPVPEEHRKSFDTLLAKHLLQVEGEAV